ncbi:hypothetical protein K435DRAFT_873116, partial [Dendrothele bispora CBS 962.96]
MLRSRDVKIAIVIQKDARPPLPHFSQPTLTTSTLAPSQNASSKSRLSNDPSLSFTINPALPDSVRDAIAGAVKPDTRIRHQRAVKEFLNWADTRGLRADEILPAPESTLLEYAATFAGRLAGGTVNTLENQY